MPSESAADGTAAVVTASERVSVRGEAESECLPPLRVRWLGQFEYERAWTLMRRLTDSRGAETDDELWLLEHPPVFTLGQAGLADHLLDPGPIPVVRCDRGGQVTYHGPGQLVAYLLLDLKRARLGVKRLVQLLEQAVIELLTDYGVEARSRADAPGVYVGDAKIASVGLRVRHGCSYHGIALNVDLDPAPFQRINPCGYPGLAITRLCDQVSDAAEDLGVKAVGDRLAQHLASLLHRRQDRLPPL